MGGWQYVRSRLTTALRELLGPGRCSVPLRYVGRAASASTGAVSSPPSFYIGHLNVFHS